jgi:hypothetical protein
MTQPISSSETSFNEYNKLLKQENEAPILEAPDRPNVEASQDLETKYRKTLTLINTLPPTAQRIILNIMNRDEYLIFLERPDFWRGSSFFQNLIDLNKTQILTKINDSIMFHSFQASRTTIITSSAGTVVFLVLIFFILYQVFDVLNFLFFFALFPILLVVTVISYVNHKKRYAEERNDSFEWSYCIFECVLHLQSFVALTNHRLIISPSLGTRVIIPYNTLIEVRQQTNYFYCRKELAIRRYSLKDGKPKVSFLDSVQNLETYEKFLNDQISSMTNFRRK